MRWFFITSDIIGGPAAFTKEDIEQFVPKMMDYLKPEKIEEIRAIAKQFSINF
ncbi:hypothetical protein MKZ25_10235 [Solibacillus sp. FSL W7-1464]|uniref:hypothetical protein n=1 Tax=Solibacillus sp. FSL W7-1464 TaxID=2921706 RepID=UPI0030FB25E8